MAATSTSVSAPTSSSAPRKAIVLGSTGAVGSQILSLLASDEQFSQVHSFVRRPSGLSPPSSRVQEHAIDYEKVHAGDVEAVRALREVNADVVFIALGTTRKDAGSASAFERIDREYVVKAAEAARAGAEGSTSQRVVYCSAQAANPSSWFLYPRSKGLTERALAELYPNHGAYLFRPGFLLNAQRAKPRPLEKYFGYLTHYVLSRFTDSAEIDVRELAKSMIWTGVHGREGLRSEGNKGSDAYGDAGATVVSNAEAKAIAGKYDERR